MRCLSCGLDAASTQLAIFNKIVVCKSCLALAEHAEADIDRCFERAKQMTKNWLSQHIMQGGLLRGGNGLGRETTTGVDGLRRRPEDTEVSGGSAVQSLLHEAAMSSMRSAAGSADGGIPDVHSGHDPEAGTGR